MACHNTDCATAAERTYYLIGYEARLSLSYKGGFKGDSPGQEASKSSSVGWRLLQDTQGIQNRLKIEVL